MPAKTIHPIGDQSGGVNTFANARDIDDREYSKGYNVDSSIPGEIRCVGEWGYYFTDATTSGFSAIVFSGTGTNDMSFANSFGGYTGPVGVTGYEIMVEDINTVTSTGISFVNVGREINIQVNGVNFTSFSAGDIIKVTGSASNNATYTIDTVTSHQIIVTANSIVNESAGATVIIENQSIANKYKWRKKLNDGSYGSYTTGITMTDGYPSFDNGIKITWTNINSGHVVGDAWTFTASVEVFENVKPGYGLFPFQTDFNHASPAVATEGYYLAVAKTILNASTDLEISMYHQPQLDDEYVTADVITIPYATEDLSSGATADFIWVDGALRIFDASLTGDDHNFFPHKWRLEESGLTYFLGTTAHDLAISTDTWKTTRQQLASPSGGKTAFTGYDEPFKTGEVWANSAAMAAALDITSGSGNVGLLIMGHEASQDDTTDWDVDYVGWGKDAKASADYYFYYSYLYENSQESLLFKYPNIECLGGDGGDGSLSNTGKKVTFIPVLNPGSNAINWDTRITGIRLYYSRVDEESDVKYFVGEFPVSSVTTEAENVSKYLDDFSSYPALLGDENGNPFGLSDYKDVGIFHAAPPTIFSHASMSGIRDTTESIACKYKTATLVNRRLYVGNIKQKTSESSGIEKKYPDRIIKSLPNKFDTLPDTEFIDVAIRDGEEIIKLESMGSRLLQFKQNTLYTIAVAGGEEYLDGTYKNMGVLHPHAVTKTDFGVFWVNRRGAYIYTGEKAPVNLIDGKISLKEWREWITKDAITGYMPKEKKFLVINDSANVWASTGVSEGVDMYIFNLLTQSWNQCTNVVGNGDDYPISNIVNYVDSNQEVNTIMLVGTDSLYEYRNIEEISNNSMPIRQFSFQTKDIHAGAPHVRKKFYKVYITYKGLSIDGVQQGTFPNVSATITGPGGQRSVGLVGNPAFEAGTSSNYWRTAVYEVDSSDVDDKSFSANVYSAKISISGTGVYHNFKINDISLVFRPKSVK